MTAVTFYLATLLTVGMVNIVLAESECKGGSLTCDKLPKLDVPSIQVLVSNGPVPYEYSLSGIFDCATQLYTVPKRGSTCHIGSSPLIQGNKVKVYQYTVDSDNKTIHSTICNTGVDSIWFLSAVRANEDGLFYCIYSCNGAALAEFGCVSNNEKFLPEIEKAVAVARRVPNGDKIHKAQKNCTNYGCIAFN